LKITALSAITALVGMNGAIDFMCFPHFDSPTILLRCSIQKMAEASKIFPRQANLKIVSVIFSAQIFCSRVF
jgi:hypothetical protein